MSYDTTTKIDLMYYQELISGENAGCYTLVRFCPTICDCDQAIEERDALIGSGKRIV